MDEEMQYKIDKMIMQKKAKDRKILQNNPPQKETLLKQSKDNDAKPNRYAHISRIPGEFGFAKKNDNKSGINDNIVQNFMDSPTDRSPGKSSKKRKYDEI